MHTPAYLHNMVKGKYAQPQCPLSCSEKGRLYDIREGIRLLPIAYEVLTAVLCERQKPLVKTLIGPYQCGFRSGKSTTDQIFTLRQILEKTHEKQVGTHHFFVDYKVAFDSLIRDRLFAAMFELGIPVKVIRLCRMTLSNSCNFVKVKMNLSEPFDIALDFRQNDPLSCDLFNFVMESDLRKAGLRRNDTISEKCPVACIR